jgi:hypothetical protein
LLDQRVIGEIAVRHECADAHASVCSLLDCLKRQPGDVDQPQGAFDIIFHQIDEIGAAGDEFGRRIASDLSHRVGDIRSARVLKVDHHLVPIAFIACSIAATMLG